MFILNESDFKINKLNFFKMKDYLKAIMLYAKFSGRASKKEYWNFVFCNASILFCLLYISSATGHFAPAAIYIAFTITPALAIKARRFQDTGKSGWLAFIPFYGFGLTWANGDNGANKYGDKP